MESLQPSLNRTRIKNISTASPSNCVLIGMHFQQVCAFVDTLILLFLAADEEYLSSIGESPAWWNVILPENTSLIRNVFPTRLLPYNATSSEEPPSYNSFSFSISFSLPMSIRHPPQCRLIFLVLISFIFHKKNITHFSDAFKLNALYFSQHPHIPRLKEVLTAK